MTDPYIGEIRMFAGTYAPEDWAACDGALLPISQNTTLFAVIGTIYGGDGRSTLQLPNMKDRAPMGQGHGPGLTSRRLGEWGGFFFADLMVAQMPAHTHNFKVADAKATAAVPEKNAWLGKPYAKSGFAVAPVKLFKKSSGTVPMNPDAIQETGGTQPHENCQPFLGILFIISLQGMFPPRPN